MTLSERSRNADVAPKLVTPEPCRRVCQTVVPKVRQKRLESDPTFQSGDWGAETEVDAFSEGDMSLRFARQIKPLRIDPLARIAIGRTV